MCDGLGGLCATRRPYRDSFFGGAAGQHFWIAAARPVDTYGFATQNALLTGGGGVTRRLIVVMLAATVIAGLVIAVAPPYPAEGQTSRLMRIASTSGLPHVDVANYRRSPFWRRGMPTGANAAWRTFMRTAVGQVTRGADATLHTGDQVQGRWHNNAVKPTRHVFGTRRTASERRRHITVAGDTIYPWLNRWFPADTLWAIGDHEIGDIGSTGVIPPSDLRYKAHSRFVDVWRKHHGPSFYQRDLGPATVVTLHPFVKWRRGILPRIATSQLNRARRLVNRADREGDWVIVQSEIPAVGPNRAKGSSRLLLGNGRRVIRALSRADLFLGGEFHAPTLRITSGPVHIVHGGTYSHPEWLWIDVFADQLRVTARRSETLLVGTANIWAPTGPLANRQPRAGPPRTVGRAVIMRDGLASASGVLAVTP